MSQSYRHHHTTELNIYFVLAMEGDSIKPGSGKDEKRLVNMAELQVCKTELAYVTGVDKEATAFFAQLCKFTNDELLQHNKQIHDHCKAKMKDKQTSISINPKVGNVLCARYALDGCWYRVIVKSFDDENLECKVYFIDYGNIETISYSDLIEVSPTELSTIEHSPFGFYCRLENSDKYPDKDKLLQALHEEYIMIKPLERLDFDLWRVILPNVAYNQAFVNTMQQAIKPK